METQTIMFKIIVIKEKFNKKREKYCEIKSERLGWRRRSSFRNKYYNYKILIQWVA